MKLRTLFCSLCLGLLLAACKDPPSRWDQAATAKLPAAASGAPEARPGSAFNTFFPADGVEGTSRVFSQEKAGFAEAKLKQDGKEIAVLSISDAVNDPDVKAKFASATDKLEGMPLVTVGKNQSALLVKDRYQVKVSSPSLDAEARKAWLGRFNLSGLGSL